MASKKNVKVLFADPNTGLCYPHPENKEDKPYVSYEELGAYITSRGDFLLSKVKEHAVENDSEASKKAILIMASAFEEIRQLFNEVTTWVKESSEPEHD